MLYKFGILFHNILLNIHNNNLIFYSNIRILELISQIGYDNFLALQ